MDEQEHEDIPTVTLPLIVRQVNGRPSDYNAFFTVSEDDQSQERLDYVANNWALLMRVCENGATDTQIAATFNTRRETVWRWRNSEPVFGQFIDKYKNHANKKVVDALYERATGLTVTLNKAMVIDKQLVMVETEEYYPPDLKAIEIWLYNRDPESWKKMQHTTTQTKVLPNAPQGFDYSRLEPHEIELLIELSRKAAIPIKSLLDE
jgi:hypothetical protein